MNGLVAACRDLLLAYHHVPQVFDERAIRAVLADMQPEKARILWGSQNFQVEPTCSCMPWGISRLPGRLQLGSRLGCSCTFQTGHPVAILHIRLSCTLGAMQAIGRCSTRQACFPIVHTRDVVPFLCLLCTFTCWSVHLSPIRG